MLGKLKITVNNTIALSNLSAVEIERIAEQFVNKPSEAISYIKSLPITKSRLWKQKVAIKESPGHAPDALVESLTFTIPSWIDAIERAALGTDYNAISSTTKSDLKIALVELIKTTQTAIDIMEESQK